MLGNFSLQAQDLVASFLNKHGKDDNLEIVSIGEKMLVLINNLTSENQELNEAIKGLENICIVSSRDTIAGKEYYESAQQLLSKSKGFEEILSLGNENETLLVMVKESKGIVKELVLLSSKDSGFSLISMSGNIDLGTLIKYSGKLNIKGLDDLRSIKAQ
jgi:hypothetical protein